MSRLSHLEHTWNFFQRWAVTFWCILNPNLMRYPNKTAGQMDAQTEQNP